MTVTGDGVIAGIAAIIAAGTAIGTTIAIIRQANRTSALERRMEVAESAIETRRHTMDRLYDIMKPINARLNPDDPGGPQYQDALHALEYIATGWQSNAFDKQIVVLNYGDTYLKLYEDLRNTRKIIPNLDATGPDLLAQNRAVAAVATEIEQEKQRQHSYRLELP